MTLDIFAKLVKETRAKQGITQKQLAELTGVSVSTISSYEKAEKYPTLDNAVKIAKVLNVSLDWLSGMAEVCETKTSDKFNATEYFNSLITVLLETSTEYSDGKVTLTNPDIIEFAKKISDIIRIYRDGTLDRKLFETCLKQIQEDFSNFNEIGCCVLQEREYKDALNSVVSLTDELKSSKGHSLEITVNRFRGIATNDNEPNGFDRSVKLFVTPDFFEKTEPPKSKQ